MNIGEEIINEIIKQKMVRPYGDPDTVLTWNGNAAEQLACLVCDRTTPMQDALKATREYLRVMAASEPMSKDALRRTHELQGLIAGTIDRTKNLF
jgi:hypothetical protein